ncbi:hypothetical protein Tco_0582581 [Tanacetum coccineum]
MLGATTYMIWQEKNVRIFQAKNRTEDVITQLIIEQFMTSLMSLTVKDTNAVRDMKENGGDNNGGNTGGLVALVVAAVVFMLLQS